MPAQLDLTVRREPGRMRAARAITEISSPAGQAAALLLLVGLRNAHEGAGAAWGGVAAVICAFLPMAYVVKGARDGRWENHHVPDRAHRRRPLLFGLVSVAAGAVLLALVHAPRELIAVVVAMIAGLIVALAVTLVWKMSIHAAVTAGTTAVLVAIYGPWLLLGVIAVAAVGWSRITLSAHTWPQVVVGALTGATVAATVFATLR